MVIKAVSAMIEFFSNKNHKDRSVHAILSLNFSLEVLFNFNCDCQLGGRRGCSLPSPPEEHIRVFGKVFFKVDMPSFLPPRAACLPG